MKSITEKKTLNGYSPNRVLEILPKYIRKGLTSKAIYAGLEIDFMECLEQGEKFNKELVKRLMTSYLEDVGLAALNIWKDLDILFDKVENVELEKKERTRDVINIINILSKNTHSNLLKIFDKIYDLKEDKKIGEYLSYFPTVQAIYSSIDEKSKGLDLSDNQVLLEVYQQSLKNRDLDSPYWAKKIDEQIKSKSKREKMIFDTLKNLIRDEKKEDPIDVTILGKKWYSKFDTKDRYLTYYLPIIVWISNEIIKGEMYPEKKWKESIWKNILVTDKNFLDSRIDETTDNVYTFYPELDRFYRFTKMLLEEDVVNQDLLETKIDSGNHFRLTNYATTPFTLDRKKWKSVEEYYQANKFQKDSVEYKKIRLSKNGLEASKIGGDVKYSNREEAIDVLRKGIEAKFKQNEDLLKELMKIKGHIIYNFIDKFQGVGPDGKGENITGILITNYKISKLLESML